MALQLRPSLAFCSSFTPKSHHFSKAARSICTTPTRRRTSTLTMSDYTLYYAPTPNGKKITLALEEMNLPYEVRPISFSRQDQFSEEFIRINPNSKIPALVDHTANDFAVFESGAILEYLAEKTGMFLPKDTKERFAVKQWLYWQMAGLGPMLGQVGYFFRFAKEDVPHAKERYLKEGKRLFAVLDKQLEESKYVAGEYSIADMACFWWVRAMMDAEMLKGEFDEFENVKRWVKDVGEREAVKKAESVVFDP